ncbi:MAG: hypothetical protein ACYTBX_04415 [Planctomycetota bacterium]
MINATISPRLLGQERGSNATLPAQLLSAPLGLGGKYGTTARPVPCFRGGARRNYLGASLVFPYPISVSGTSKRDPPKGFSELSRATGIIEPGAAGGVWGPQRNAR